MKFAYKIALVNTVIDQDSNELEVIQERSDRAIIEHLSVEQGSRTQGPALQEILAQALESDTECQTLQGNERTNYRNRLRYRLAQQAREITRTNALEAMTIADYEARRTEIQLQARNFEIQLNTYIRSSAARQNLGEARTLGDSAFEPVTIDSDDEEEETDENPEHNYGTLAKAFMQDLLNKNELTVEADQQSDDGEGEDLDAPARQQSDEEAQPMREEPMREQLDDDDEMAGIAEVAEPVAKQRRRRTVTVDLTAGGGGQVPTKYPACADDETVSAAMKARFWRPANLRQHLQDKFHSR